MIGSFFTVRGWRLVLFAALGGLLVCGTFSGAVTLTQVISREHPNFNVSGSTLAVGRDGNIYLASSDYVLRVNREGKAKLGGKVIYAMWMVAANKAGTIATANAHFNHSVNFWSPTYQHLGAVSDFLSSDPTEWFGPCDVQAGETDFYGMDQNRNRIVRVAAPGKIVTSYSLQGSGEDFVRRLVRFRLWEQGERFYLLTDRGMLHVLGFDGKERWSLNVGLSINVWEGWHGAFEVDDAGTLYTVAANSTTVKMYDPEGKPAGDVTLQMGDHKGRVIDIRVYGDEFFVKRPDPSELFQVYDRATGALKRVVYADIEQLTVTYPNEVWTAGQAVPLAIDFKAGARKIAPQWRVWLRPLNTPNYTELPVKNGQVIAPAAGGGLYQLKVSAGLLGGSSDYVVQSVVEVRQPGATGTLSLFTPANRLYYGQGEEIPVSVVCRGPKEALPATVTVQVKDSARVVAEGTVALAAETPATVTLPTRVTAALRPGWYTVTASVPGFTTAPQLLIIGPGIATPPVFSIVQHGDYSAGFPGGDVYEAPDTVAAHLARTRALGTNMFVDRIGASGAGIMHLVFQHPDTNALVERLKKDTAGTAPEKAQVENPLRQAVAGYGAFGIEERGILLTMDAGLPVGTGFDSRKPEQFAEAITNVSQTLAAYPAFRGWSWAANWWIGPHGAAAAADDAQKQAYTAAYKQAMETGKWDSVLDTVSNRWLAYAIDAERQFDAVLQQAAPGKISAMTGPYRAVTVIPPLSFQHTDEIDLQYQAEQIQPPQVTPHNVDFYKRPGKRAWGHPELWNDDGTGGQIFPTLLQMVMRGADGVGWSGNVPAWGTPPSDTRATGPGIVSIFRTLNEVLTAYGPWQTTLKTNDQVAIVCSSRMLRLDTWGNIGGVYFTRLYEAYNACLYAHRPASFVFVEDLQPGLLNTYKAVLVVSQQVAMEPQLLEALRAARAAGVEVFYDGTCREELVKEFAPLKMSFNKVEKDSSAWQDDAAYYRFPGYFTEYAKDLTTALAATVPPVAGVDNPEIMLSERVSGDGHYLWVINNTTLGLEPGVAWRVAQIMSQRMPVVAPITLNAQGKTVYDVFALKMVTPVNGVVQADLRTLPAHLYAILPSPIAQVDLRGPKTVTAGQAFDYSAWVEDTDNKAFNTSIPMRIRLYSPEGAVLSERYTAAQAAEGARGTFTMSLTAAAGAVKLEAVELISGKTATLLIPVTPLLQPVNVAAPAASQTATADAATIGKTTGVFPAPELRFGPHLKGITLSADGTTALINAMNWEQNLYAIDLRTGSVKWRQRIGHHFAYGPVATQDGFAVQGYDLNTAEGYHLYLLGKDGKPERRFALYGLPKRANSWAAGATLLDRINNFAVAPNGGWVASAGDLGLAVWSRAGKLLWSRDWWQTTRQRPLLLAQDDTTLVTLLGTTVTAYQATSGKQRWQLTLADTGALQGGVVSAFNQTLALRADTEGGRVFIIRGGTLINTLTTPADDLALSPDGTRLAVTTGNQLKWFDTAAGLLWCFTGDDTLRGPRIARDSARVAAGSELGSLYVLDGKGNLRYRRDCGALPTLAWMANGDLLAATWMGAVVQLDYAYTERRRLRLQPTTTDIRPKLLAADPTPTVRMAKWGNTTATPALTPNLLKEAKALITVTMSDRARELQNRVELLTDGAADAPAKPWLDWTTINYIDSGWSGSLFINFDTFHTQLKVTGITCVEDPAHPESWLRDMRLQYWDAAKEQWIDGPYLLSNTAIHTHMFAKPVEAAKFRLMSTGGGTWPAGNIRLGEIVFHGEVLGASHPDVVNKKPLAVLFDENESDLKCLSAPGRPFIFKYDDAYAGGKSMALTTAGSTGPAWIPPYGHAVPNWDFEIAENPQPGQYRWIQFAWKALAPQTTGMSLLVGRPWPGGGFSFVAGKQNWGEGVVATKQVNETVPTAWQVVRVDLWSLYQQPIRLQSMSLAAVGGGAAFDQLVLGRTEADLPPIK